METDNKVVEVLYKDNSFEQDLLYINGLVKTRVSTSSNDDPALLELGKVLKKYMVVVWSIEAYPDLITCAGPELAQVKKFARDKLYSFAKKEDTCFSPDKFTP